MLVGFGSDLEETSAALLGRRTQVPLERALPQVGPAGRDVIFYVPATVKPEAVPLSDPRNPQHEAWLASQAGGAMPWWGWAGIAVGGLAVVGGTWWFLQRSRQ